MSETSTFTTKDLFSRFREQGHNRRTKSAWETGIKARATGEGPYYEDAATDYRFAYYKGWRAADDLIRRGSRWKCGECDALHPEVEL